MRTNAYIALIFGFMAFVTPSQEIVAQSGERKIILVENAKTVSDDEVQEAAASASEKNPDGGYDANTHVVDIFAVMKYHYTGGRYHDEPILFRMLHPEHLQPGKKYPLIIWLHGAGESGSDNTRQLSHVQMAMKELAGKDKLDFYMILTQCPGDNIHWETSISPEGQGDAPLTIANEILETALEEFPIDTNRISVIGVCSGGGTAWSYVAKHPERFAAMASCSATPGSLPVSLYRETAIWVFNNKDDTVPYKEVVLYIDRINASGGTAWLTLRDTGGHDTWYNALVNKHVIGWLVLQDKRYGGPPADVVFHHRTDGESFQLFGWPALVILVVSLINCTIMRYRKNKPLEKAP